MLDDVLGPWFAVLVWGNDPRAVFDEHSLATLDRLGVRLVSVRPPTQLHWDADSSGDPRETADVTVVSDRTGRLKTWFDQHPVGFVVIRPDRYVAAAALAQDAPRVTTALAAALCLTPGDHDDTRALLHVAQPAAGPVPAGA
jgi:3-(3-hydroxy-phenyl)propionate hydroxylase